MSFNYEAVDPAPFLTLLIVKPIVSERDVCLAYGFTSQTKSWPAKVSLVVAKSRALLAKSDIILARAVARKGWSLPRADRLRLRKVLEDIDQHKAPAGQ